MHLGHLNVAITILEKKLADRVWMMPCRLNPLKDRSGLLTDSERIEMLEKAIAYYRRQGVSGIEINLRELSMPSPSYTVDTVKTLMAEHTGEDFRLVVGADSYLSFRKWKDWEWLEENLAPIAFPRPGYEIGEIRPLWTFLEGVEEIAISSTQIREMETDQEQFRNIMPWSGVK